MSTAVHSRVGEYSNSVSRFQAAAAGLYSGPSMPVSLLGEMVSQTDGINTQELVAAAGKAAGKIRGVDKGEGFSQFLKELIIEVGAGLVVDFLTSVQDLHDQDADGREKLVEDSNRCALAIDDTVHVTGVAIVEILAVACRVLELLAGLLMRRGNSIVDAIAPALAEIGDRIIESTNSQVAQTCRDRDDTIERCYLELEKRCEGAIQTPIPQAPEVGEQCAKDVPPACPRPLSEPACPVTSPNSAQNPQVSQLDTQTSPVQTAPVQMAPARLAVNIPVTDAPALVGSAPSSLVAGGSSQECTSSANVSPQACIGVLGGLGAGIALIGLGALALAAAECLEEFSADCGTEAVAETKEISAGQAVPASEPAPAPTTAPASAPETAASAQGQVIAPPAELSHVAEPTPPAQKVEMLNHAERGTGVAAQSTGEVPATAEESGVVEEQTSRTHKAGTW